MRVRGSRGAAPSQSRRSGARSLEAAVYGAMASGRVVMTERSWFSLGREGGQVMKTRIGGSPVYAMWSRGRKAGLAWAGGERQMWSKKVRRSARKSWGEATV